MTAIVLGDALGPRARRRVRIITVISAVLVAAVVGVVMARLATHEQLTAAKWRPLTQWTVVKFLLVGLGQTVKAAAAGMVLATVVGVAMALGRLAPRAPVRWVAGAYVEFFRAIPLLLLIFFAGFALPKYGIHLSPFESVVAALVVYNGAVLGEIFRAGVLSLDRGQSEAAYALGMTYWQTMFLVVIPQAARRMVPAIVSQLVTLLKDTSLGLVVSYDELLRRAENTGEYYRNPLQSIVAAAVLYIAVNFTLSRIARRLEVRQRRRYKATALSVAGVEDLTAVAVAADAQDAR
ncbi:MAG: amino acid ABC transporter permease [Actinobacteria bacterium]|nr:amino acid ABC transporter permease [Actinomycetota bacterium]